MGRYLGPKCKLCRREGMKLFLKGTRCSTEKCAFAKRPVAPGMHRRAASSKASYYSLQLREKQKVKRMYGVLEKQFKRFFRLAAKVKGATGRTLIQLLERRLDNVVYRSLFALTRREGRQIVGHGAIFIKNRRVDIPSYLVKVGDVIEIKVKDSFKKELKDNVDAVVKERSVPSWLEVDNEKQTIKVVRLPEKEDLVIPVSEQLIVELYSK